MRAFLTALLGVAAAAGAEYAGLSATLTDEQGLPGILETHASQALRPGMLVVGASNRTRQGASLLRGRNGGAEDPDGVLVSDFRGFTALGLGLGSDLSLSLPYLYENVSGGSLAHAAWSLGDVSAVLKATLPWQNARAAGSVFALASVPTSSGGGLRLPARLAYHPGGDAYPDRLSQASGLSKPSAGLGVGITLNLSDAMEGPQLALHGNLSGERILAEAPAAAGAAGTPGSALASFSASLAAETFLAKGLRLEAQFRHQRVAADFGDLGDPMGRSTTLALGLGWLAPMGLSIGAGGLLAPLAWNPYRSLGITDAAGTHAMEYRSQSTLSGFLRIAWQGFPLGRDRDHDGVPDGRDRCPLVPEDRDGFQDEDGCPDPDNDQDGVPDAADGCPYVAEDHDDFEDGDGCPEPDNDHDGFLDAADRCPNDAEDRDGFQDADGCPDPDDDGDGIPDSLDQCPRQAENFNGIEDRDGCPETDSDGDGIPDSRDKCPNEDEIINFYQDDDGCPDEKPEPIGDAVLPGIDFNAADGGLLPGAYPALDALAIRLAAYPGTEIEIQAYLDDRSGADAKERSQARAEAVAEYLESRGIEARRMKPVGYGAAKPIASNRTAQGRMANRRIQIHRLN